MNAEVRLFVLEVRFLEGGNSNIHQMKKIKNFVLSILLTVIFLFALKQLNPVLKLDGYSGLLLNTLLVEETKFSENYSHKKFLKIKEGMTKEEVLKIIGNPIVEWNPQNDIDALQYSESPSSTHYRLRQVYLKDNKVAERISYFYID